VANGLDAAIERVLSKGCWSEREMFGSPEAWAARPLADDEFEVLHADSVLGRLRWGLLGEHNRMNALAAIAAANHAGVSPSRAIAALSEFKGVKRRMEIRGRQAEVTVYDDFAHHPTAIETTLAGLRAKVGAARILAVLEPRSNTMKLGVMKGRLAESLRNADRVFVSSAGLGWDPAAPLASLGERVRVADSIACLVRSIAAEARAGDHVLVMSNGGFDGIHGRILDALAARISGPDSITQAAESRVDPASDSSTVPR
jgi:UDP-N-acetylmuramate: L-alanyl-gamma-D-glutamyl-meso-diaminopimelate ligase